VTAALATRPRPLLGKLTTVGTALSALAGLVTWAASFGLLTVQQEAATSILLAGVPGIITAVSGVLVSFGVVKSSEPLVTPISDPAIVVDGALLPLTVDTNKPDQTGYDPDVF
jgi:hypothetical protein